MITDGVLGGSVNFSVAPMQYGATNSMTISQEGEEIKYDSIDQFKEEIEAMEETYESGETATESSTEE